MFTNCSGSTVDGVIVCGLPAESLRTAFQARESILPVITIWVSGLRRSHDTASAPREISSIPLLIETIAGVQFRSAHQAAIDSSVRPTAVATAFEPPAETAQKIAITAPTAKRVKSVPNR